MVLNQTFIYFLSIALISLRICANQVEKTTTDGYDIQWHASQESYKALYTSTESASFAIIKNGERRTGTFTATELKSLRDLLNPTNHQDLENDSWLGKDSIPYPMVSIRFRHGSTSVIEQDIFVIIGPDPEQEITLQLLTLVKALFKKYEG